MSREPPALVTGAAHHRWILPGLLAAAVASRIAAALLAGGSSFRFVDEALYADAAEHLRAGAGLPAYAADAPGYPIFLALLGLVAPGGVLALRVAQGMVVAVGALLCFELGRRLGGRPAGLTAAALFSLDPLLVVSSALLYPEATAGLLLTGALLLAWEAVRRERASLLALAGLLLGFFTLFRPTGLALAPVMTGWIGTAPGQTWSRRAARAAVLIGAWSLPLIPWAHRNYQAYGSLLPISSQIRSVPVIGAEIGRIGVPGAIVTAVKRDPPGFTSRTLREFAHFWELYPTRLVTDDGERRESFAKQDPRLSAALLVRRSARDLVSALSFGLELSLAIIGIVFAWRHRRREALWLVGVALSFALGYAVFHGKLRYRIPILPIVLAFAGLGAASLGARLRQPRPRRAAEDPSVVA